MTAVAVGVAGCSPSDFGNVNAEDGRCPHPSIPERAFDGWELTDRRAEHSRRRFAGTGLDQDTRTELYNRVGPTLDYRLTIRNEATFRRASGTSSPGSSTG